ncbi:MAG: hypothetical protein AAGH15_01465 [Myxococcota bacterium]
MPCPIDGYRVYEEDPCPFVPNRLADRPETVAQLAGEGAGAWVQDADAETLVRRVLVDCFARWEAALEATECDVPGGFDPSDVAWYPPDPEDDGWSVLAARLTGDLLEIETASAGGQGTESGTDAQRRRIRVSTCEGVTASRSDSWIVFRQALSVDAGGAPAVRDRLLADLGLVVGYPDDPAHDLASFLARGPYAVYSPDVVDPGGECERPVCLGPRYPIPPWRAGRPVSAEAVWGRAYAAGLGEMQVVAQDERWEVLEAASGRTGNIAAYAVYDRQANRSRWFGVDVHDPWSGVDANRQPPAPAAPLTDGRFLWWRTRLVDLEGGQVYPTWPPASADALEVAVAAAAAGTCDFACGEGPRCDPWQE